MIPTLSQVCSLSSSFEDDIVDYAAGHCTAVELWLTKLESYVEANSVATAKALLRDNDITVPVVSSQGGLLTSQGDARREAWDLFERRLALCEALDVPTIVVACDIMPPIDAQTLERAQMSLAQAGDLAAPRGVRVAVEFQANAAFANNLQTLAALLAEIANSQLGICLDAFHFFTGRSKLEDLAYLTCENLFHVQLCDLADVPRELASDADRILPGDGDLPLQPIVDRLHEINYDRSVSIELMNPQIWQIPPRQFGEIAITSLRKLLGQAEM